VDTKKKELLGAYRNAGRQWRAGKTPHRVKVHDFPGPTVPRAYPYGIDAELATVRLWPNAFHGEWNYAIRPHTGL